MSMFRMSTHRGWNSKTEANRYALSMALLPCDKPGDFTSWNAVLPRGHPWDVTTSLKFYSKAILMVLQLAWWPYCQKAFPSDVTANVNLLSKDVEMLQLAWSFSQKATLVMLKLAWRCFPTLFLWCYCTPSQALLLRGNPCGELAWRSCCEAISKVSQQAWSYCYEAILVMLQLAWRCWCKAISKMSQQAWSYCYEAILVMLQLAWRC